MSQSQPPHGGPSHGQGKPRGPEFFVYLELGEPRPKADGSWDVRAMVRAEVRGHRPLTGKEVLLYEDGVSVYPEDGRTLRTDSSGRAVGIYQIKDTGTHVLEVVIEGTTSRDRKEITLTRTEPKRAKAAKLLVSNSGRKGVYQMTFQVLSEENLPVSDATIRILDLDDPAYMVNIQTEKDGSAVEEITVTKKRKRLEIEILGTEVRTTKTLYK